MKNDSKNQLNKIKAVLFLIVWLILFIQIVFNQEVKEQIFLLLDKYPIVAPFIFILLQILFATFALPCSPLTIFAGILWGLGLGIIYSTIATLLASSTTFLLGRYIFKKRSNNEHYLKVLDLIDKYRWKASLVAHLNPIFPASPLGYAFGLSNISFLTFIYGVILGTLPLQVILVGSGSTTNLLTELF